MGDTRKVWDSPGVVLGDGSKEVRYRRPVARLMVLLGLCALAAVTTFGMGWAISWATEQNRQGSVPVVLPVATEVLLAHNDGTTVVVTMVVQPDDVETLLAPGTWRALFDAEALDAQARISRQLAETGHTRAFSSALVRWCTINRNADRAAKSTENKGGYQNGDDN